MHCQHTGLFLKRYEGPNKKYCTPHLPQRTIFHPGLSHVLRSHRALQSPNEPQRQEQTRAKQKLLHMSLATQALMSHRFYHHQDYYFTGLFCHRFILHIGPLYALLPHRSKSLKDTKVKTKKNIAHLICHKGLSSTKDYCMLYGHTGLYKVLTSHKGENKPQHNRNYSPP